MTTSESGRCSARARASAESSASPKTCMFMRPVFASVPACCWSVGSRCSRWTRTSGASASGIRQGSALQIEPSTTPREARTRSLTIPSVAGARRRRLRASLAKAASSPLAVAQKASAAAARSVARVAVGASCVVCAISAAARVARAVVKAWCRKRKGVACRQSAATTQAGIATNGAKPTGRAIAAATRNTVAVSGAVSRSRPPAKTVAAASEPRSQNCAHSERVECQWLVAGTAVKIARAPVEQTKATRRQATLWASPDRPRLALGGVVKLTVSVESASDLCLPRMRDERHPRRTRCPLGAKICARCLHVWRAEADHLAGRGRR